MKKILLGAVASLTLSACDLDYFPNDSMTSDQMAGNPSSTEYSTDGNYSMFKDVLEYKGSEYSGSTYVRYFFQMSEFRGDNVCLANKTEDPLYNEICYNDLETDLPTSYFWWCAYHIIYGANASCVMENMLLAAVDQGLAGVYLFGISQALQGQERVAQLLQLPEGFRTVSAIAVGHPAQPLEPRSLTLDKIATNRV